jgi:hypothetical protein
MLGPARCELHAAISRGETLQTILCSGSLRHAGMHVRKM